MRNVYVYSVTPIDYWTAWQDEMEYVEKLLGEEGTTDFVRSYLDFRDAAMALAKNIGWEGDIRGGTPYVTALPSPSGGDDFEVIVAWKQNNNGQCFIASPVHLSFIETSDYVSGTY